MSLRIFSLKQYKIHNFFEFVSESHGFHFPLNHRSIKIKCTAHLVQFSIPVAVNSIFVINQNHFFLPRKVFHSSTSSIRKNILCLICFYMISFLAQHTLSRLHSFHLEKDRSSNYLSQKCTLDIFPFHSHSVLFI